MDMRVLFLFLIIALEVYSYKTRPYVVTSSGAVLGDRVKILDKEVNRYLGIPYAVPPIDDLRFRKPIPVESWEGIYEATEKPAPCVQHNAYNTPLLPDDDEVSEDCLYVNLWVPHQNAKKISNTPLKAIMVWIYGGAFRCGSSGMDYYDGGLLASHGDVIVASMNYRVGVFGFLNADVEEASGNMGLLDQRLAIQWIKENAKFFGGDPNLITLFGESAGSASVAFQTLSPMNQGLFSRGIMQSATPYHPEIGGESTCGGQNRGDKLAKAVGCSDEKKSITSHPHEVVSCLKGKDASLLAKAEMTVFDRLISFLPSYGDEFMPNKPIDLLREGSFNNVEMLTGSTSNEAALFFLYHPIDMTKKGDQLTEHLFADTPISKYEEISERYFGNVDFNNREALFQAIYDAYGDYLIVCPEVLFSDTYSKVEDKLYYYIFDHHPSTAPADNYTGMTHFEDVQFVFGDPLKYPDRYTQEEVELSRFTMDTWVKFAKTGNPITPGVESWPRYNSKDHSLLWIKLDSKTVGQVPNLENCKFWDKLFLQ